MLGALAVVTGAVGATALADGDDDAEVSIGSTALVALGGVCVATADALAVGASLGVVAFVR